ncbi:hypothetical protein FACS1894147_11360 [Spirochaetia bacterium]|nr:hypothetical protein FACS1894147_11360 [Spirochaetia bacterium]
MKKSGVLGRLRCLMALLALLPAGLVAQVDQEELRQNQGPVYFINNEGPYDQIETLGQIRNIGYGPGEAVRAGTVTAGGTDRYFVIHSITAGEEGKLNADIFGLGPDVGVDHIRNLRLIIQGYLEGAYGYNAQDAALLAQFITIYNAVYRGNWDYFTTRYKTAVAGNLTREKAGISVRYDDWPGQTLMVIPLGPGGPGSLSAVSTTQLTEDPVINEMRKEEDLGVDPRKDMVDLKEREAEEAEQKAAEQRVAIAEEEKLIREERQELAAERAAAQPPQGGTQGDAPQTPQVDPAKQEELAQKEAELDRREEAVAQQKEEAQQTEAFAEQKADEAQKEREDIAQDQQALIIQAEEAQQSNQPEKETGVLASAMSGPSSGLGWLLELSLSSGNELKRSLLSTVNLRTLTSLGSRLLAVAGENRGNSAIRLVEISPDTLEMVGQGNDDISPESLIWINGADLYAINSVEGGLYLARFNTDLGREARSTVEVHPYAAVRFLEGFLFTQRADGSPLILNPKDLTEKAND